MLKAIEGKETFVLVLLSGIFIGVGVFTNKLPIDYFQTWIEFALPGYVVRTSVKKVTDAWASKTPATPTPEVK